MSFRGSGRFFTESGRPTNVVAGVGDFGVEANTNRFGEEISQKFRWNTIILCQIKGIIEKPT